VQHAGAGAAAASDQRGAPQRPHPA
jgi:hypothetical protein